MLNIIYNIVQTDIIHTHERNMIFVGAETNSRLLCKYELFNCVLEIYHYFNISGQMLHIQCGLVIGVKYEYILFVF